MALEKGEKIGALNNERHERDHKLLKQFEEAKIQEMQNIKDSRAKIEGEFKSMGDLQELIKEAERYRDEIEDAHVRLQVLSIDIRRMEDGT